MQIKQNANRAAGLVRQLLAFSRRQTLRPQTLQLGDVLSELQMLLRRLVGETIELEVVHGRDLWLVKADLNQFEQVIVNLVVNARDAMPRGRQDHAAHPQRAGRRMRARSTRSRSFRPTTCSSRSRTPATAFRPRCATRSSSRSSPPRRSARAPASACRWSTASSSRPAATCSATASRARARSSASCCRASSRPRPRRRRRRRRPKPAGRPHRPRRDPAGRGRGGGARLRLAGARLARLYGARGRSGVDALRVVEEAGGADRSDRLRRHHAGDGRADHADGTAQARRRRPRSCSSPATPTTPSPATCPERQEFVFLPKPFTLKQLIETVKAAMA